jgi:ribosome maturation factor RimP
MDHKMSPQDGSDTLQVVGITANPVIGQVWRLAEPLCLSEGLELVHIEYQREQSGRTLRLYLDKPGGVTLDDCAAVSRQLGDILDVSLESEAAYRLEISSPGLNRPLGKLEDFKRFSGRRVKVRTRKAVQGQKNRKTGASRFKRDHSEDQG